MRFTTKTEYGVICLVYMAKHPEKEAIAIKELVRDEKYSVSFTEKILQKLRSSGIVTSHQGSHGGYSLAKKAAEITLKDIVDSLEGGTFEVFCEPDLRKEIICSHSLSLCEVKPVWTKTKEVLDQFFGSITLEMIAGGEMNLIHPKVA